MRTGPPALVLTNLAARQPAPDKAVIYTIAVIVCVIIVWIIIFAIPAALFGMGMMM